MKTNIFLIELGPVKDDGSRDTISEHVIASCDMPGEANLITYLLRNEPSYKELLNRNNKNGSKYLLTCEKRKPIKNLEAIR